MKRKLNLCVLLLSISSMTFSVQIPAPKGPNVDYSKCSELLQTLSGFKDGISKNGAIPLSNDVTGLGTSKVLGKPLEVNAITTLKGKGSLKSHYLIFRDDFGRIKRILIKQTRRNLSQEIIRKNAMQYTFDIRNGKCVLDKVRKSTGWSIFSYTTRSSTPLCKKLDKYFKQFPAIKACSNTSAASRLMGILGKHIKQGWDRDIFDRFQKLEKATSHSSFLRHPAGLASELASKCDKHAPFYEFWEEKTQGRNSAPSRGDDEILQ